MPEIVRPPIPRYEALRLPNGRHSGVCVDRARLILEVQRDGIKYYFDLALFTQVVDKTPEPCYDGGHER